MTRPIQSVTLALVAVFFVGCGPIGGGGTRTLNHTYQDPRGVTFVTLFDTGTEVKGEVKTIGHLSSSRNLTMSSLEFESLWGRFDEKQVAPYATKKGSGKFNAKDNYVIVKGVMPDGTTTYVVPKSKAPTGVKNWVQMFREKTKN
jgi:hypothetical protein